MLILIIYFCLVVGMFLAAESWQKDETKRIVCLMKENCTEMQLWKIASCRKVKATILFSTRACARGRNFRMKISIVHEPFSILNFAKYQIKCNLYCRQTSILFLF